MSNAPTLIYLVRHGATDANEQRPYVLQGASMDHSLSETGKQQANYVGMFLSKFDIDVIYASPMKRAVETAQAIASHHSLEVQTREKLVEVDVGKWEGMNWDDIMSQYPSEYKNFMSDPSTYSYYEGETYGDVLVRTQPVIEELLEKHVGKSIVVVAHNVVNRVIVANQLGLPLSKAKDIKQANACLNVIKRQAGETALVTMNANFHLPQEMR
ncbi:phosphoglycerate mutase family protein [hydrothermal vent metagenome]|uniref:Phosphoglycerate mutase family protein n=1 Tax=hydrothermal vent metagenome TaxID=652676 RepID=A0A3B1D910_9ZZZZ